MSLNEIQVSLQRIRKDSCVIAGLLTSQLSPRDRGSSLKIEQQLQYTYLKLSYQRTFVCLSAAVLLRKEVIQPHLPIRLPCYDLTPIIEPTFGSCLLAVSSLTSGVPDFHGLTGGVYKARERIHRGILIRDY